VTLYLLGRTLEAEKLIHRAIVQYSGSEDAPDAIPWQVISHARAVRDLGRLDEAAAQAEHAYALARKNDEQTFVNQALLLRASICRMRGDLAGAQRMLAELEPRMRRSLPPGDLSMASLLSEEALVAQARGDVAAGLDLINQSLTIAEASAKAGKQGADLVPTFLTHRSGMERQLGRMDDAVADASRALAVIREVMQPGTSSSNLGHAYLALGQALLAMRNLDKARPAFRSAAEELQDTLGPDHPDTRVARQLAGPAAEPR
jgi:tetratricopeptide (TPR) repeat protein